MEQYVYWLIIELKSCSNQNEQATIANNIQQLTHIQLLKYYEPTLNTTEERDENSALMFYG